MSDLHDCLECRFLSKEDEGWEMPHIAWWECCARPAMHYLTSFPFRNTKCRRWSPVPEPNTAAVKLMRATTLGQMATDRAKGLLAKLYPEEGGK